VPGLPRLVLVASRQAILQTARGVAVGSSLDRRRSALSSRPALWRAMRIEARSAVDIQTQGTAVVGGG
jgi:hypothetical protein